MAKRRIRAMPASKSKGGPTIRDDWKRPISDLPQKLQKDLLASRKSVDPGFTPSPATRKAMLKQKALPGEKGHKSTAKPYRAPKFPSMKVKKAKRMR